MVFLFKALESFLNRMVERYQKDEELHDETSRSHKVQAMIDRAKNRAAEEDAK